ncbi:UNVERIFIED_ORG: hypothetical protein J2W87_001273 [Pseudomonas putida]|nr:hypothetical protein [Pseudomonas putida]
MTDDVNAKLDAIFNARSEREAEAGRVKREAEIKQDANLQEFLALKDNVIRPTLEALAQKLSDRGQESKIFEITDGEQLHGKVRDATIGIRFLLDGAARYRDGNEYPHLTLTVDKAARRVQFYYSTMSPGRGGTASGDGFVDYDALSAAVINEKALKVIAAVFK